MKNDYVIDTNVLLVASCADINSPFDDSKQVSASDSLIVFEWLSKFSKKTSGSLVIDGMFKIFEEYTHKLSPQDYGYRIIEAKLTNSEVRLPDIEFDSNNTAILPKELTEIVHDLSDRKFVATSLKDISGGNENKIVNACDSDWEDWEERLKDHNIHVLQLLK